MKTGLLTGLKVNGKNTILRDIILLAQEMQTIYGFYLHGCGKRFQKDI